MSDSLRARRARRGRARECERGLVLLTLLIALMLVSVALMGALDVWALQRQRQQEEELLFVGNQYRLAIERYYLAGRALPTSVDDLLEDKRFPVPVHHLRRAYPDPITGKNDWLFLLEGDRIFGVYSSSVAPPIKRANFPRRYADFANAKTYAEWQFFYVIPGRRTRATNDLPSSPSTTGVTNTPVRPGSVTSASPFSPKGRY